MLKIKDKKVFFCSDTHYSHTNICRGVSRWRDENGNVPIIGTRPFSTLEEMNETIIANINKTVGQDDVLIHFGDWSFGGIENIQKFQDRIYCKNIYLLIGNHDHHIEKDKGSFKEMFLGIFHYQEFLIEDLMIVACHYPIGSWNKVRKGSIMLHGHLHNRGNARFTGDGKTMDVGIDGHPEFRPYSFEEIKKLMEKRPIKTSVLEDHHG
jgi:calcineurin-like phosphoesterase family protein